MKKHAHRAAPSAIHLALNERDVGEAFLPGWHYFILSPLPLCQGCVRDDAAVCLLRHCRMDVCGRRLVLLDAVLHFRRFKVLDVHDRLFMLFNFNVIRLFTVLDVVDGRCLKMVRSANGRRLEDERTCLLVLDIAVGRRLEA
jgi:hypothetical protein